MRYLCLLFGDETVHDRRTAAERRAMTTESLDYDDTLRKAGQFVAAHALQPPRTARTVKVRGGKVLKTDGPFMETKEQLGGFILIEAKDMDEAVEVAAKIPMARLWTVEVRPVATLTRGQPGRREAERPAGPAGGAAGRPPA
ncbi:MAG TPA: YciI family protein [Methylomirabilota bacterium]|nr:YciI family protein [Methylomirabilota bacterium]